MLSSQPPPWASGARLAGRLGGEGERGSEVSQPQVRKPGPSPRPPAPCLSLRTLLLAGQTPQARSLGLSVRSPNAEALTCPVCPVSPPDRASTACDLQAPATRARPPAPPARGRWGPCWAFPISRPHRPGIGPCSSSGCGWAHHLRCSPSSDSCPSSDP